GTTQGIRMKNPAHPGGFIKHEIIEPLELSVTGAAEVLGVTRAALSALLNERAHLSPEMALRLEKAFGVSMDPLMRMQNSFDIAQECKSADDIKVKSYQDRSVMLEDGRAPRTNATRIESLSSGHLCHGRALLEVAISRGPLVSVAAAVEIIC